MRFVLVQGGYHGAWCWDRLTPELEALGHEVLAIDLPGAGERVHEAATLDTWRCALKEVIDDGDALVGHSMGGFAISLAADEVPDKVARLIYLSAAVPVEGESMHAAVSDTGKVWSEVTRIPMEEFVEFLDLPSQGPCIRLTRPEVANAIFYHDCSPEDQTWLWGNLTPLPLTPAMEPFVLPRFWGAPIPRDFIVCTDDRSHSIADDNMFMRRLGLNTSLGIASSHSPFISRPADTARLLDVAARSNLS